MIIHFSHIVLPGLVLSLLSTGHFHRKSTKHSRWAKSRIANHQIVLQCSRLLRVGDISLNQGPENNHSKTMSCPGPMRKHIVPRCSKCEKPVARNHKRLECETCHSLTHIWWANTNSICRKNVKGNQPGSWTCSNCFLSVLPFQSIKDLNSIDKSCESLVVLMLLVPMLQALRANRSHLSMMHLNTQSMTSTFEELSLLISDYPFDIVTLYETWLNNNRLLLNHVSFPSYVATYLNQNVCKGVWVGAYIKTVSSLRGELILRTWKLNSNTCGFPWLGRTRIVSSWLALFVNLTSFLIQRCG